MSQPLRYITLDLKRNHMLKKHLSIAIPLLFTLAANHAIAQVYKITAKYCSLTIYSLPYGNEMWFDMIDTGRNYAFVADIGKKTMTNPAGLFPRDVIPITEIVHDKRNHFYILKYKKEAINRWNYYKLQLSADDSPLYIQVVENRIGSGSARDTFFFHYTNDLATLSFSKKYTDIKDTVLSADKTEADAQIEGLRKTPFRKTEEPMEMRNGYINWTREGLTHHLRILSTDLVEAVRSDGITLRCAERDNEYYEMTYLYSDRKVDEHQNGRDRYIVIIKYVDAKRVWAGVLR